MPRRDCHVETGEPVDDTSRGCARDMADSVSVAFHGGGRAARRCGATPRRGLWRRDRRHATRDAVRGIRRGNGLVAGESRVLRGPRSDRRSRDAPFVGGRLARALVAESARLAA